MIDPNQLGQAATGLGVLIAGVFGGYQAWKARKGADKAAEHAYPISNGWGTALREDMAAVRRATERIAEAQVLAERREIARDDTLRVMADRLSDHIEHHPTGAVV